MKDVFITGGTGYMGVRVAARLVARGHRVRALARAASAGRLPAGVEPVIGDALVGATYGAAIAPADAFVHLVGTPHRTVRRPRSSSASISPRPLRRSPPPVRRESGTSST
ncbi:MAG TPA: NAD-dependent epimerase/dehydratase family protein [Burkholderiales bacterium]|nr:NAD-dependent epimerase/dehydratase family protein [Burkholderiales bacterium]